MNASIGAIADDYTGATDVAVAFRRAGLRTVLYFGTPGPDEVLPAHDALVVALKSRMLPAADAVAQSLAASRWLTSRGVDTVYFKYCSTFDSTPEGNIGPVLDALCDDLDVTTVVMTPSSPEHGRTQYLGHLFVGDLLLSESHMRHHPVTPMNDSNLTRLLSGQTASAVEFVRHPVVARGGTELTEMLNATQVARRYLLVDAIDDGDLRSIGSRIACHRLVAGAAGLAGGLANAKAKSLAFRHSQDDDDLSLHADRRAVVLSGSCSARTLEQLRALWRAGRPGYPLDPVRQPDPAELAARALAWYDALTVADCPVFYSSMPQAELHRVQDVLGVGEAARILEDATGRIAQGLVDRGVSKIIAAGGETSGAVVSALRVHGGVIGDEEARGVPWIHTTGDRSLALLLKSGNFGDPDLLVRASASPLSSPAEVA